MGWPWVPNGIRCNHPNLYRGYGLFNVKGLIMSSFFMFEIGSAVCGAAPTSNALIVGRVIAGVGGAGMYLG